MPLIAALSGPVLHRPAILAGHRHDRDRYLPSALSATNLQDRSIGRRLFRSHGTQFLSPFPPSSLGSRFLTLGMALLNEKPDSQKDDEQSGDDANAALKTWNQALQRKITWGRSPRRPRTINPGAPGVDPPEQPQSEAEWPHRFRHRLGTHFDRAIFGHRNNPSVIPTTLSAAGFCQSMPPSITVDPDRATPTARTLANLGHSALLTPWLGMLVCLQCACHPRKLPFRFP